MKEEIDPVTFLRISFTHSSRILILKLKNYKIIVLGFIFYYSGVHEK